MTPYLAASPHVVATALCCALSMTTAAAGVGEKQTYNIPKGDAATTLNQFARASGRHIVFMMDKVRDEKTNALTGHLSAREALDRMLAGTGLSATEDPASGAFVVSRKPAATANGAAQSHPPRQSGSEEPTKIMNRKNPLAVIGAWLALALAPVTHAATAESTGMGTVTGNVSNAATGNLLEGATVTLPQLNLSTFTDNSGRFVLTRVPAGTHELMVSYIGLDPVKASVDVAPGQRIARDFDLTSGIYKLEAFTVTGELEGDAKAITEKRNANSVKDIVAMDSFGNLPNYATGEVVRRLPGVAGAPSDEDQFDGFNIRGMGPGLNLITFDGGLYPTHNGMRNFELHQVSSTMFESLELIKGHTPDTGADSLGGTINLKTRSPLSLRGKRDTHYKFETRIAPSFFEQSPLREQRRAHPIVSLGHQEVFDLFGGQRNLGVAVNLYYSEYGVGGTNTLFDYQNTIDPGAYIWDYRMWDNSNLTKQQTLSIRADYRLTPTTKLTLALMGNDSFERHRRTIEARAFTGSATIVPSATTGIVPGSNEKITVVRPTAGSTIDIFTNGPRNFYLRTRKVDVGAEHEFQNLLIDYTGGISTTHLNTGGGTAGSLRMLIANTGWIIDRTNSDSTPDFRPNGGLDFTDPNNYRPAPAGLANLNRHSDQQLKQLRFNARYQLPIPVQTFLKAGFSWREQRMGERNGNRRWNYIGTGPLAADPNFVSYHEAKTGLNLPRWQSHMHMDKRQPRDPSLWQEDLYFHESQKFAAANGVTETVPAAYIQAQGRLGREGFLARTGYLGGVRVERTEVDSFGWVRSRVLSTVAQQIADPAGSAARDFVPNFTELHGKYTKSFPSVHVYHDVTPNLKARASYSTSFGRPPVAQLRPGLTINEVSNFITINNPALKPQTATNWDATLEYYFGSIGSLSAGWFHKEIKDYILANQEVGIIAAGANNGYDGEYVGFSERTSLNAGTAIAQGWEFSYNQQFSFLPGLLKGLSATANYTWITTHGDYGGTRYLTKREVPGFIPYAANVSLGWRYRKFNARVLYNFNGEYVQSFNAANPALSQFRLSRKTVNVSLGYQWKPAVNFSLDAANIFNDPQAAYRGFKDRRQFTLYNFVTITAGVNGRF